MGKTEAIRRNVKSVLSRRVRLGFFTVPLWVLGLVVIAGHIKERYRRPAY